MTVPILNSEPIGAEYHLRKRTFPADTPRCVLASALEEAGRLAEAELLRGPNPVVLGHPVKRPSTGDVVRELRRLVGEFRRCVSIAGSFPDGYTMVHLDDYARDSNGYPKQTGTGYQVRWPAGDTDSVFVALRREAPNSVQTSWQAVRTLAGTGSRVEIFRRVPADEGADPAAGTWEWVPFDSTPAP